MDIKKLQGSVVFRIPAEGREKKRPKQLSYEEVINYIETQQRSIEIPEDSKMTTINALTDNA